jgi:hypothetical protein
MNYSLAHGEKYRAAKSSGYFVLKRVNQSQDVGICNFAGGSGLQGCGLFGGVMVRPCPSTLHHIAHHDDAGALQTFSGHGVHHLAEGRQDWKGKDASAYGCSITDACISFEQTVPVLDGLAAAVRARRALPSS